jgi:hypothetical protein
MILSACIFFARFRDARNRTEEHIYFHDWQLRQLVPLASGGERLPASDRAEILDEPRPV